MELRFLQKPDGSKILQKKVLVAVVVGVPIPYEDWQWQDVPLVLESVPCDDGGETYAQPSGGTP